MVPLCPRNILASASLNGDPAPGALGRNARSAQRNSAAWAAWTPAGSAMVWHARAAESKSRQTLRMLLTLGVSAVLSRHHF